MNKIFIGLFFVSINFHLDIGSVRIGLAPDFIGYILIFLGMRELEGLSGHLADNKKICIPAAVLSGILYSLDLTGMSAVGEEIDLKFGVLLLCEIIISIISLKVLYNIVKGIEDIEHRFLYNLNYEKLIFIWKAISAAVIITYVCLIFVSSLALFAAIANLILTIILLYQFNITRKRYFVIVNQQEVNQ